MGDFGDGAAGEVGDEPFQVELPAVGGPEEVEEHDAGASPFSFDPTDMDSLDDMDLNQDGVVDHGDLSSGLHGLHHFHVEPPEAHHHVDHVDDHHGLPHH